MTWEIEGIGKLISGIKTEIIKLEGEMPVVHVQFPPGTPKDRSAAFAQAMRHEFPPDVRIIFTTPGVKLEVHRPKTVNLTISDCEITLLEAEKKIEQILKEKSDIINIRMHNVIWKKSYKKRKIK